MESANCASSVTSGATTATSPSMMDSAPPQAMLLEFFFPGFSVFTGAIQKYLKIDLNVYIPLLVLFGTLTFAWRYFSEYFWGQLESHFMSTVDIRTDDEIYNMLMSWVATQRFAQGARRFVVNTNLNSRSWFLFRWDEDEEDMDYGDDDGHGQDLSASEKKKKKALSYTPTFGSHYFIYKNRVLIFRRSQNTNQQGYMVVSEREEISVSCFGRNPWVLKELLLEARTTFIQKDEAKTLIYRGTNRAGSTEPTWQRCMARTSRPFSTVILNDKVKKDVIADVTDYLNPSTRRWYSNRGIPYRRGYLLYGPPGTGKSSLSLALAGFFKMKIYMVSLSSVNSSEENLATLFAELPRRCVVLLEDIDTAGLTHTRDDNKTSSDDNSDDKSAAPATVPGQLTTGTSNTSGRLSLSGLLNILDGVASQEGRVLIMTTNHLEKLDKALIRPGRVDMIVKFDLADHDMIGAIFRAIYAPLESDEPAPQTSTSVGTTTAPVDPEMVKKRVAAEKAARDTTTAKVEILAAKFADAIPAHEFSPAELQGFLLKNKRDPEAALAGAEEWIVETRKEKQEKQLKEAEEKRKEEEKKKKDEVEEKKKKDEAEEKKKKDEEEAKEKAKKDGKKSKRSKKGAASGTDESSDASSDDSEIEKIRKRRKEEKKVKKLAEKTAEKTVEKSDEKVTEETKDDTAVVTDVKVVPESAPLVAEETAAAAAAAAVTVELVPDANHNLGHEDTLVVDDLKKMVGQDQPNSAARAGTDSGYGTP